MAFDFKGSVRGDKELSSALRALPGSLDKFVIQQSLRAGAQVHAKQARKYVRGVSARVARAVKVRNSRKVKTGVIVTVRDGLHGLARLIERGRGRVVPESASRLRFRVGGRWVTPAEAGPVAPRPFMSLAAETERPRIQRAIQDRAKTEIDKIARELNGRFSGIRKSVKRRL